MGFGSCWKCRLLSFILVLSSCRLKVTFRWASQFVGVESACRSKRFMDCLSKIQGCLGDKTCLELKPPYVFSGLWHLSWRFYRVSLQGKAGSLTWEESAMSRGLQTSLTCCCVWEPFHSHDFSFIISLSFFLAITSRPQPSGILWVGSFLQKIVNLFFKKKSKYICVFSFFRHRLGI